MFCLKHPEATAEIQHDKVDQHPTTPFPAGAEGGTVDAIQSWTLRDHVVVQIPQADSMDFEASENFDSE